MTATTQFSSSLPSIISSLSLKHPAFKLAQKVKSLKKSSVDQKDQPETSRSRHSGRLKKSQVKKSVFNGSIDSSSKQTNRMTSKMMNTEANLFKSKSLVLIVTLATILVMLVAATIECHYFKRTQYHEQGLHGPKSYKFGYTTGDHKNPQERHEVSDGHGHVKGWYSFVDANGKHQVVHYEASKYGGFRILNHKKPYNNGKRHYNS